MDDFHGPNNAVQTYVCGLRIGVGDALTKILLNFSFVLTVLFYKERFYYLKNIASNA